MAQPDRSYQHDQARIAQALADIGFALPGSLVQRTTACGKTGCRCQADPPVLHGPYLSWIRPVAGKTVTRKLTAEQQARYQSWFDNARRLHQLVAQLHALSVAALEETEGWARRP